MEWENIGTQQLPKRGRFMSAGHVYQVEMWRSPVPGGWMVMALNLRSNSPDPVLSFYPDPNHTWDPLGPRREATYLLRAAEDNHTQAADELLRGSEPSVPDKYIEE